MSAITSRNRGYSHSRSAEMARSRPLCRYPDRRRAPKSVSSAELHIGLARRERTIALPPPCASGQPLSAHAVQEGEEGGRANPSDCTGWSGVPELCLGGLRRSGTDLLESARGRDPCLVRSERVARR